MRNRPAATRKRSNRFGHFIPGFLRILGGMFRSLLHFPASALGLATRTVVNQVRFTCVQAVPYALLIAVFGAMPILVLAFEQTTRLGLSRTFSELLVRILVRELGPLLMAILVAARSGTAMGAEIATAKFRGETDSLEAMGVDPLHYYVIPRLVGFAVSIPILTLLFDAAVLAGGWLVVRGTGDPGVYLDALRTTLTPGDLVWTVVAGMIFGAGIVLFVSQQAFLVGRRATEIPVAVSRGTMASILWVLGTAAAFSAGRYLL